MATLLIERPLAYVNHGRWLVDCVRRDCANAEQLTGGQSVAVCQNCRLLLDVTWPADPDGVWDALACRPVPQTRNWYPTGHHLALRWGLPHGQTPADLRVETADHMGA